MKWIKMICYQAYHIAAVFMLFAYCKLPFVKSHFDLSHSWPTRTSLFQTPFVIFYLLTLAFYICLTIRNSRRAFAAFTQPIAFYVYLFLIEWGVLMFSAYKQYLGIQSYGIYNTNQFMFIGNIQLVCVIVGTLFGVLSNRRRLKNGAEKR